MAFSFDRQDDTVRFVFDPSNYAEEQSHDFGAATDLLINVMGDSPVWVSDTTGDGRAGTLILPGVPTVIENPAGDLYIYSGDGQNTVYISPGALVA
jgi:hypothetical protein